MAPSVRKNRASSPAPQESENAEMITQKSEYIDAGKENCSVSKTENLKKLTADEVPKKDPVTKPVEGEVALEKSRLGFKVLAAAVLALFIVLAMLLTIGTTFAVTMKVIVTAFGAGISEKAAFLLTRNGSIRAVCALVLSGAIGLIAFVVKKRLHAKKAA